jgi:hypothetical protein
MSSASNSMSSSIDPKQMMANLKAATSSNMIYIICGIIMAVMLLYAIYYKLLESRQCNALEDMYPSLNPNMRSIDPTDEDCSYSLRDYYIKTAFNCCSGGGYKNDYVSTCALKSFLKQGVRGLDFEIYSIDDQPVVATSTEDDFNYKETFNHVSFADVLNVLRNHAFSSSTSPNPKDPVIVHLRIKSENQKMYTNLATLLQSNEDLLLGREYSNENINKESKIENLGTVKIVDLMEKITIIVDRTNPSYLECPAFCEFVNMTSNSVFMKILRYNDIKYSPDIEELIESNKTGMTIAIPDSGAAPPNPSGIVLRETGCQMLAMRYQLFDTNLQQNELAFDVCGYAFCLKPEHLRYIPVILPDPPPQKPELSYATRNVSADYYSFEI